MPGGNTGGAARGKTGTSDTPEKGANTEASKGARPKEGADRGAMGPDS